MYGASSDTAVINTYLNCPQLNASIVVLRESSQCVAILRFDATKLVIPFAKTLLAEAHDAVQELMDDLFNQGPPVVVPQEVYLDSKPSAADSGRTGCPPATLGTISYKMSQSPAAPIGVSHEHYTIVKPYQVKQCPVCLVPYTQQGSGTVVRLEHCRHVLHLACLEQVAAHNVQCPLCRQALRGGTPRGEMASGTMTVTRKRTMTCAGFAAGTLEIQYFFPEVVPKSYLPNPVPPSSSAIRTAYIPDSKEGRLLLSRLQEAFRHGLTFATGTSLTSGKSKVLNWASILHKTKLSGGVGCHGFPDPHYFTNCHEALDALRVQPAVADWIADDNVDEKIR